MTAVSEDDSRSPGKRFADFLTHIDTYHRFYGVLLGRKGSPWFAERTRRTVIPAHPRGHRGGGRSQ